MTGIQKKWAVIDGEEVLFEDDSESEVRRWARRNGYSEDDVEILALPKAYQWWVL